MVMVMVIVIVIVIVITINDFSRITMILQIQMLDVNDAYLIWFAARFAVALWGRSIPESRKPEPESQEPSSHPASAPSSHSKNSATKICSRGWVARKSFFDR